MAEVIRLWGHLRRISLIDVISVGGAIIGSMLLASNTAYSKWGYVFYMGGTFASIWIMLHSNVSRSQVIINVWFIAMNTLGIVRWFGIL